MQNCNDKKNWYINDDTWSNSVISATLRVIDTEQRLTQARPLFIMRVCSASSSGVDSGSARRVCSKVCGFLFLDCTARCVYSGHLSVTCSHPDVCRHSGSAMHCRVALGKLSWRGSWLGTLMFLFCFFFPPSHHLSKMMQGRVLARQMERILNQLMSHIHLVYSPQKVFGNGVGTTRRVIGWTICPSLSRRIRSDSISCPGVSHSATRWRQPGENQNHVVCQEGLRCCCLRYFYWKYVINGATGADAM